MCQIIDDGLESRTGSLPLDILVFTLTFTQVPTRHKGSENILNKDWKCLFFFLNWYLKSWQRLVTLHVSDNVLLNKLSCQAWLFLCSLMILACFTDFLHKGKIWIKISEIPFCGPVRNLVTELCLLPITFPLLEAQNLRTGVGICVFFPNLSHFLFHCSQIF